MFQLKTDKMSIYTYTMRYNVCHVFDHSRFICRVWQGRLIFPSDTEMMRHIIDLNVIKIKCTRI